MSTFYGVEQLVRVLRLQDSQSGVNSNSTIYTVPSGRYAELTINYASIGDVSEGSLIVDYANSSINQDTDQSFVRKADFLEIKMHAGDSYKYIHGFGINSFQYVITIKEYLIP